MRLLNIVLLMLCVSISSFAQLERKYKGDNNVPNWVKLMYTEDADPGAVIEAHDAYFRAHLAQKNAHTQYYKRWVRSFSRQLNFSSSSKSDLNYLERSKNLRERKDADSEWICIGPYDFDKDAASRSYAPGSAHVYTVERSLSNPNIMYAGTATAGLWKSTNAGANWSLMTKDLVLNRIFALEIDHSNPDIVYFESNGDLFKTNDGGLTWSEIGDASFQSEDHNVKDIVMHPSISSELYLSSNRGFFKSTDG